MKKIHKKCDGVEFQRNGIKLQDDGVAQWCQVPT